MCVQELKTLLVTKRDGREVEFQKEKIERAIFKAETELNGEMDAKREAELNRIVDEVLQEISRRFSETIQIYEIQSIIEHF